MFVASLDCVFVASSDRPATLGCLRLYYSQYDMIAFIYEINNYDDDDCPIRHCIVMQVVDIQGWATDCFFQVFDRFIQLVQISITIRDVVDA